MRDVSNQSRGNDWRPEPSNQRLEAETQYSDCEWEWQGTKERGDLDLFMPLEFLRNRFSGTGGWLRTGRSTELAPGCFFHFD